MRYVLPPRSVNVDTPEKPKRPWWRKKRWAAALALLLVLGYPVSEGPAEYVRLRWMSGASPLVAAFDWAYFTGYRPLDAVQHRVPGLWSFRWQWKQYWADLEMKHRWGWRTRRGG